MNGNGEGLKALPPSRIADELGSSAKALRILGRLVAVCCAALRVEPHIAAVFDDLEAKAVPFGLVQPIVALGRAESCGRGEGMNEIETWRHDHCRGNSAPAFASSSRRKRIAVARVFPIFIKSEGDSQISWDLSVDYRARKYTVRTRDTEPSVECARTPGLEHSSGRKPDWRRCHDEIVGYCILRHPIRRCPGARGIGAARRWHTCRSRRCARRLGWSLPWRATRQEPWWLSGGSMGRTTLLEGWPLVWVRGRARLSG